MSPPLPWFLLGFLTSLAAPQSGGEFAPPPAAQTQPAAAPAATVMTDAEAEALTRSIMPRVEEIRGLKFLRPVPVKVVDDAAARVHFEARLAKFWPEEQMRTEQIAYQQLGLLPADANLTAGLFSLLEEQAGGYYDPGSDTFYVLDDMPRSIAPMLMAHELTHALDDQHFNLDALFTRAKDDFDRSGVVSAVVEGSGTLVMSIFLVRELQAGRMTQSALTELAESEAGRGERLKASPSILKRGLLAPYLVGMGFVLRGDLSRVAAGVRASDLDRALSALPESSEQILHPEKYWDTTRSDPPLSVPSAELAPILGPGWTRKAEGTLGELTVAILTGSPDVDFHRADAADASLWTNAASTGWGGDRWQLYGSGEKHVTVLTTLWDTPVDATEFEAAATRHMAGAAGASAPHVSRSGTVVVLVAGEAGESASKLAAAAIESAAKRRKK